MNRSASKHPPRFRGLRRHIGGAAGALVLTLTVPTALEAGSREDREACWSSYSVCVIGAGREERWRTVCYSDYSACMKNPGEISCAANDEATCGTARDECAARGDGSEIATYHCKQDYQVCLDSFGC